MKQRTLYQCELCCKEYSKEDVALDCEKKHKTVKKVEKPIYNPADKKSEYPESVIVIFEGGESARYYRK